MVEVLVEMYQVLTELVVEVQLLQVLLVVLVHLVGSWLIYLNKNS